MTLKEQARGFEEVWKSGIYGGFSKGTIGQNTTPLLDALIAKLADSGIPAHRVVEGGSGSGDHSITLAQKGFHVTAVEYSEVAAALFRERKQVLPCSYRDRISVVQGDLLEYLGNGVGSFSAFYANSVLHFFKLDERNSVYKVVYDAQPKDGLIAVSFKAEGDSLQRRGDVVNKTEAGPIVRGEDGIERLFVNNPVPLINELERAGYNVPPNNIYRWEVEGYNHKEEPGRFIGFLATKQR